MGKAATAAGTVAAATIYTGGRVATNVLSWVKSAAIVAVQAALLKKMLDKQKDAYDDIAHKQRQYVEQALNDYILEINNFLIPTFADAYPDVPVAAPYVPVDPAIETFNQMVSNIGNLPKVDEYVKNANYLLRTDYAVRMEFFSRNFWINVRTIDTTLRDMIHGKMPGSDLMEILTDTAEQAALTGRIGAVAKTTGRNLGISQLRMRLAGQEAYHKHLEGMNRNVSPIEKNITLDEQMLNPVARMTMALQQAQLIQNSLQNINNTAAQKPPFRLAVLQTKIQTAIARLTYDANKGNMVNQFVPNYAAVLGPAMNNVFDALNKQIAGVGDEHDRVGAPGGLQPGEFGGGV